MGQYAILIVLSALILTGVMLFNAQQKAQGADDDLTEYHEDRFGREIALVGLKRTERLLAQNADEWDLHTSNNAAAQDTFASPTATTYSKGGLTGTYQVTYDSYTAKTTTTPELATVTALGTYNGKTYTIRATYEQGETDIGVPPSMRAAIVTDQTLNLQGSNNLWGSTHSNGQTNTTGGNGLQVDGQGTYTTSSFAAGQLHWRSGRAGFCLRARHLNPSGVRHHANTFRQPELGQYDRECARRMARREWIWHAEQSLHPVYRRGSQDREQQAGYPDGACADLRERYHSDVVKL